MNTIPRHFPGANPDPVYIPPSPPGRWVWIPDGYPVPYYIPPRDDGMCDACRRGGVCGCVRPGREPVICGIDPAAVDAESFTVVTVTRGADGTLVIQ